MTVPLPTEAASAELGRRLYAARKRSGLLQRELAAMVGVTYSQVSQWESGRRNPSFGTLLRVVLALDVGPCCLLGGLQYL